MPETEVIAVNGAPITYEVTGSGSPLLLVHGGLGDRRMWDDQMEPLAQHFQVIRYDQHGYGDSPMPAGSVTYHEDVYGLLRALGIARAHLVGVSFGAGVVIDFAISHPEMILSLVPVSSVIGGVSEETKARINEADEAAEAGDLDQAVELELRLWIDGVGRRPEDVDPAVRERVRSMNRAAWEQGESDVEVRKLDPPARRRLSEINAPTLIVTGQLDLAEVQATADLMEREIRGTRRVTVPEAAHHPQMEQPAFFNRAVLDFLSAIAG